MKLFVASALSFLFLTLGSSRAEKPSLAPKVFRASISGFNGPTYLVELHAGSLIYTSGPRNNPIQMRISPTPDQWREFRRTLDTIDIWRWHSNYTDPKMRDGTQWELSLEYPDRTLNTGGSNDYPKRFDRYRAAVQKLLDGKPFQ